MAQNVEEIKRYIVYMTEEQKTITAGIFNFHGWDIDIQSCDEIFDEAENKPSRNCSTESLDNSADSSDRECDSNVDPNNLEGSNHDLESQVITHENNDAASIQSESVCPFCLSSPCVTTNPQSWLGDGRPPQPGNNKIRKSLYKKYWVMLDRRGLWRNDIYLIRKERCMNDAHVELTAREIMPECVLEQVRGLYPNPKEIPYMGHFW